MRSNTRDQILVLIPSLGEAFNFINTAQVESAQDVFEACLDMLYAINESLKDNLSIERYRYYESILLDIDGNLKEAYENKQITNSIEEYMDILFSLLEQLMSSLEQEAEIIREIVFLPYKASMWDSLESIWKAAKADSTCECYVIPIPYYERKNDRTVGELQYEGQLFPKDVPITHYLNYNIAKRKPDVIYIHNPYDGGNLVTSVAPEYYSDKLKQHTDMLVYVPYFITDGAMPKGQLNLPAYHHVDKIIVQSEKVIKDFKDEAIREKLVPLGSPKADRMIWLDENRPEIPKKLKDIIENKKVAMYNTSISSLLEKSDKALEKMKYTFQCFKDREDFALLWRPHPLTKATLKSMRPWLLAEYEKLEQEFIENRIGVLDETPDVNMSIAISDIYVGEATSSIVHLFGITGKPVFLTNADITKDPTKEEETPVRFLDCYIEGKEIWFVSCGSNTLCKVNIESGKLEVIDRIPATMNSEYGNIVKIDERLIIFSRNLVEFVEYDLGLGKFYKTFIADVFGATEIDQVIPYKNYIFIKPKKHNAIIRYDLITGETKHYTHCLEKFLELRKNESDPLFIGEACVRDNLILIASSLTNQVLEFNMDTGKHRTHIVGKKGINFMGMAFDGSDYWLIPNEGKSIVKWNYKSGKAVEYNDFPNGFCIVAEFGGLEYSLDPKTDIITAKSKFDNGQTSSFKSSDFKGLDQPFVNIVCCDSYLLAFPARSNMIIKIDIATGDMTQVDCMLPYRVGERKSCYYNYPNNFYFAKRCQNKIVSLSAYDDSLVIYDIQKEECTSKTVDISEKEIKYFSKHEPTEDELGSVCFYNSLIVGNDVWFISSELNELCKMDIRQGNVEVIEIIPSQQNVKDYHLGIQKVGDQLIILPCHAGDIIEIDLKKKKINGNSYKQSLDNNNFDKYIRYKKYIFMKPRAYPAIVRYDIEEKIFTYYTECMEEFLKYLDKKNEMIFLGEVCVRGSCILMASCKTNKILEFDMDTGRHQTHIVGSDKLNYAGMTYDGTDFWLIPYEGKAIVKWNYETKKYWEFDDYPVRFKGDKWLFIDIIPCKDYLLAFPAFSNMIIKIEKATGKLTEVDWKLPYGHGEHKSCYFTTPNNYYFAKRWNETKILTQTSYDNSLLVFDEKTEECSFVKIKLSNESMKFTEKYRNEYFIGVPLTCKENGTNNKVENFLDCISLENGYDKEMRKNPYSRIINNLDGTCGEKVHHYILKQLQKM